MAYWNRFVSVIGGRRSILSLGGLYVALAIGWGVVESTRGTPVSKSVILAIMIGVPGGILLLGGPWLSRTDINPRFYPQITGWCVAAIAGLAGILTLYHVQPAGGIRNPGRVILVFTGFVLVPAFGGGIKDATAKTRMFALEERNRELEQTQAELEDTVEHLQTSNERLEQFAYAASHDLQEPLRMVSSYLQLLEDRYADNLDEDAQEFIDFAVDGADRMRTMIDSLLEYSQVTRGDPLEPTDADAVLEDVLTDLQLRVEETDAAITTDDLPTVTADPDQLTQVFRNLVSNALAYSGDEPPRVHVGVERTDDGWQFSVADEGIGIDPEYHDRIFNVFERVHTDEETSESGAGGIGLALCERIIEHHGGEIWVESEPGEGATFYFTIPRREEVPDPGEQPALVTENSSD